MPPSPRGVATASIAGVDEAFVGRLFAAFRSLDAAAAAAVLSSIATTSNKTCKEGPNSSSVAFSSDVDDRLEHALLEAAARGDAQGAVRCVARRFVYLASTATPTADCAAKPKLKSQRKQPRPPPSHRAVHMAAMIPDGSTAVAMLRLLAEGWSAEKSAAFKAPQYCCCGSGGLHTAAGVGGREPIGLHRGRRDASSRE